MRLSIVVQVAGRMLRLFGLMFFAPVVVAVYYGEQADILDFIVGGIGAAALGHGMVLAGGEAKEDLRRIEARAVVSSTWLIVAHLGAVPYVWVGLSPVDALFESMSGFTTTGATILVEFDRLGRAMMFWRSLSQWLGGMGVITLFVAVLPRLAIDMRQIFFTEALGPLIRSSRRTCARPPRIDGVSTSA